MKVLTHSPNKARRDVVKLELVESCLLQWLYVVAKPFGWICFLETAGENRLEAQPISLAGRVTGEPNGCLSLRPIL